MNNSGWSLQAIFYHETTTGRRAYVGDYVAHFGLTVVAENKSAARAFARPFLANVSDLPPDSWNASLDQLRQDGVMLGLLSFSTNVSGSFHLPAALEGAAIDPNSYPPSLERGPWSATVNVGRYHLNATQGWIEVDASGAVEADLPQGDLHASIAAVLHDNQLGPASFEHYVAFEGNASCNDRPLR